MGSSRGENPPEYVVKANGESTKYNQSCQILIMTQGRREQRYVIIQRMRYVSIKFIGKGVIILWVLTKVNIHLDENNICHYPTVNKASLFLTFSCSLFPKEG